MEELSESAVVVVVSNLSVSDQQQQQQQKELNFSTEIGSHVSTPQTSDTGHHLKRQDSSPLLRPDLDASSSAPSDPDYAAIVDEFQKLDLEGDWGGDAVEEKPQENAKPVESEAEAEAEVVEALKSCNGGEIENERQSEEGEGESNSENGGGEVETTENNKAEAEGVESNKLYQYPVRPEAEDCSFYLKTGNCKFGSNCKFNHPLRRKSNQVLKDKVKEWDELAEKPGQTECKYYLRSGGCKYGKSCKYNHGRGKPSVAPVVEVNFLGLPIRLGERECPYYMRTGSCKYGSNCRFNHPDPTAAGGSDPPSGFDNGGPASLLGGSQSSVSSWSAPRSLNETPFYVPRMMPQPQGVPSQNTEWNGYQAPLYVVERSMPAPPPYVINNSGTDSNIYKQYPPSTQVDEFPERPGQPFCTFFLRTGNCKYKSNCKYHHPKNQTAAPPSFALSDKGLPLRPDQTICTHYSRYGICKFGPACKYDHPLDLTTSTTPGPDHQLPFSDSANTEKAAMLGSKSGTNDAIQLLQSVQ